MRTNWVATLYAGKSKPGFQFRNYWSVLFLIALIMVYSCSNDDLEAIDNDNSIEKEPPVVETPPVSEAPPDDEPPAEEVPPVAEVPPVDEESVIIYTDIEPDFVVENTKAYYELNLNNDQIVDFIISWRQDKTLDWLGIESNPGRSNKILSGTPWYANPIPLSYGELIYNGYYSQGETFENWGMFTIGDCFGGEVSCSIDWQDKGERYLGLRFEIAGKQHFAWVRMKIMSTTNWMIMDYAYNATPNKGIYAGQK